MKINLIVFALMCLSVTQIVPILSQKTAKATVTTKTTRKVSQTLCGMGTYQYQVKSGDNCYTIGITAYMAQSQGVNCNNLQVGQWVCAPYNVQTTTHPNGNWYCPPGSYQYVVKSGDTCNALGINVESASSQGLNCRNLQVGQQVCASYYIAPTSTPAYYTTGPSCGVNSYYYTVQNGDNCYTLKITQAYAASNGINCNPLQVGSTICLPSNSFTTQYYTTPYYTTPATNPSLSIYCGINTYTYTLKPGDSCYSLGITQSLAAAQNINCNLLQTGQTICAPYFNQIVTTPPTNLVCKTRYYTVAPGDSCQSIASANNYLYTDLIALNGGTLNCNTLAANQVICV